MAFETDQLNGLRIQDEGITVVNGAAGLNFVGAGVTAAPGSGGFATITIPGGGASNTQVTNEHPTDNGDGTYTLAHSPVAGSLTVYKNGVRMNPGAGNDYTLAGTIITSLADYDATDLWTADYYY